MRPGVYTRPFGGCHDCGRPPVLLRRADGPLLAAVKSGAWVLLDELNLAGQTVLEGLNAVLDHRAEVWGCACVLSCVCV